jgi:hypothetical protein
MQILDCLVYRHFEGAEYKFNYSYWRKPSYCIKKNFFFKENRSLFNHIRLSYIFLHFFKLIYNYKSYCNYHFIFDPSIHYVITLLNH